MRVIVGIVIALPIAVLFCATYLTLLAFEAWHDATLSRPGAPGAPARSGAWNGPVRLAALSTTGNHPS